MSETNPFDNLLTRLAAWRESLEELQLVLHNDRPADDNPALIGQLEDDVTEALSHLENCTRLIRHAFMENRATSCDILTRLHHQLADTVTLFATRLASPERHRHIAALATQRGRDWAGWSQVVQHSLLTWPAAAAAVHHTLADTWPRVLTRTPSPRFQPTDQHN